MNSPFEYSGHRHAVVTMFLLLLAGAVIGGCKQEETQPKPAPVSQLPTEIQPFVLDLEAPVLELDSPTLNLETPVLGLVATTEPLK